MTILLYEKGSNREIILKIKAEEQIIKLNISFFKKATLAFIKL